MDFNDKNFKEKVLKSPLPVFVDFWASWCPPCKVIEPLIYKLSKEFEDKLVVGKINVDLNPNTADEYKILGLPTFIIFWRGMEITRSVASMSEKQLKNLIISAMKKIEGLKNADQYPKSG